MCVLRLLVCVSAERDTHLCPHRGANVYSFPLRKIFLTLRPFLNPLTIDGGGNSRQTLVLSPGVEGLMRSEETARSPGKPSRQLEVTDSHKILLWVWALFALKFKLLAF